MKGLADVVAMGVKVGILYLRFDQQRSVLLDQGNPLFFKYLFTAPFFARLGKNFAFVGGQACSQPQNLFLTAKFSLDHAKALLSQTTD